MRRNDMHALRNVLQTIMGFAELNRPERIIKLVRDANLIIGREYAHPANIQWAGGPVQFKLANDFILTVETALPIGPEGAQQQALFMELSSAINRMALSIPCDVCHDLAELMLSYCDLLELRAAEQNPDV